MTLFYDIECVSNYFSCVFHELDTDRVFEFEVYKEDNDLYALVNFIQNENIEILISYNGTNYDDLFLQWIRLNYRRLTDPIKANNELKAINDKLISPDYYFDFHRSLKGSLYRNPLPYTALDLQRLHRLDYSRTSLKKVMVALKMDNILEFEPVDASYDNINEIRELLKLYTSTELALIAMDMSSNGKIIDQYNKLGNFGRYVLDSDVKKMREYNHSDVVALELFYLKSKEELKLRIGMANNFGIPINSVLSLSRSAAAEKLLIKFYADISGLKPKEFTKTYTLSEQFKLFTIIDPIIEFKSTTLKALLLKLKSMNIDETSEIKETIAFDGILYDIGKGGLHSQDSPSIFFTNEGYIIQDADVTSYYPQMIINNDICPRHLVPEYFIEMLKNVIKERVIAKKEFKRLLKTGIHDDTLDVINNGLKIVINAIFGKLGQVGSWLYDLQALLGVTLNGQLYLLSLIEMLQYEGIHALSANTDGVVCKIPIGKEDDYYRVCNEWEKKYSLNLEYTPYDKYARLNVNNYITIIDKAKKDQTGNIKTKGSFTPDISFTKGYKHPIVPKAIYNYIVHDTPIEDTIMNADDILDFCISVNSNSTFKMISFDPFNAMKETIHQKTNRYFASTKGILLYKVYKEPKTVKLASGKTVIKTKISVFSSSSVEIINKVGSRNPKDYKVNYPIYLREARSIIREMEVLQQSLKLF